MMAIPRSSMSPLEHQQFQRLKVNRIAVIQELKVDHILNYLLSKSVLNDKDLLRIEKCRTTMEKSKLLLDILPTKGRASNWYKHFRAALLNPSVDDRRIKHKYQVLVEFLDNTIIDQMSHPVQRLKQQMSTEQMSSFPKYKPLPEIANNASRPPTIAASGKKPLNTKQAESVHHTSPEEAGDRPAAGQPAAGQPAAEQPGDDKVVAERLRADRLRTDRLGASGSVSDENDVFLSSQKWNMRQLKDTKIPHSIQYWDKDPENFSSMLEIAMKEIVKLEQSSHSADRLLADQERDAADRMKQLEIAYFLWKSQDVNGDMVFCTCSAVLDIIQDVSSHHLYFKYFECLRKEYDIELALEIVYSYDEVSQWLDGATDQLTCDELVGIGFNIMSFLSELGNFEAAWQVVSTIDSFLSNHSGKWMLLFNFYVRCMMLGNSACDPDKTDKYYILTSALRDRITRAMSSFGQESLDCTELFRQTSIMMKELGNFGPSYTLAQKSMQEVDLENKSIVVNVLCTASVAYGNQWKLMRAEDLAVEAVQQAKMMFGVYHPIYVQALQNYVTFSNQFRHDLFGVEASLAALNIANRTYGYNSRHVAQAYAGHAEALIAARQFGNMVFFDFAEKAYNIATNLYSLDSPLLIPFSRTLVSSLLHRSSLCKDDKQRQELLLWAESEVKQVAKITELNFEEVSYKSATAHLQQAEVYLQQKRASDAKAYFTMASNIMKPCLGDKHGNVQKIKASLALITKADGEIIKAKHMMKEVIENFDTAAYYMSWYNEAYEALISCCELTAESEEIVKEYRSKSMGWKWISEDNRRKITWRELHSSPESYDSFLEKFELWRSKVKKVRVHLDQMKQAEDPSNKS